MFFLAEPSAETVSRFIATQRDLPFSYAAVGATKGSPPLGYNVDHNRIQLGTGSAVFRNAVEAMQRWKQFDLKWIKIVPAGAVLKANATVAVKARAYGTWSLNAVRVVYMISETGEVERFGFAYGTLPQHVETGEERFGIEWNHADDSVWYEILAFSRPRHPLVKVAAPLTRKLQNRFAQESMRRMVEIAAGTK